MVDKFNRQMYLLFTLTETRRGRTADDLLQDLIDALGVNVSIRTIYRDITELSLTFPITEDCRGGKTYYVMLEKFRLDNVQFTFRELMALMLVRQILDNLGSDPVIEAGKGLTKRFTEQLTPSQQLFFQGMGEYFHVEMPGTWSSTTDLLQSFFEAAFRRREVEIQYYSFHSDQQTSRVIHPYTIYFRQHYYIVAWCTARNEVREFRLDRVIEAKMLETTFTLLPGFDYDAYSKNCWEALRGRHTYDVKLQFSPGLGRFIREYHSLRADSTRDLPDGSLEFVKSVSILDEILPWVLSFGAEVQVLSPPELEEMVRQAVSAHAGRLGLI